MPSARFAALAAKAAAAADGLTAELWTLVPMMLAGERDAPRLPDPSRAAPAFLATFSDREAKPDANTYDRREQRRPGVVAGTPAIIVSPAAFAAARLADGPLALLLGDRLLRAADGRTWVVAKAFPMPGGTLRLSIDLVS